MIRTLYLLPRLVRGVLFLGKVRMECLPVWRVACSAGRVPGVAIAVGCMPWSLPPALN